MGYRDGELGQGAPGRGLSSLAPSQLERNMAEEGVSRVALLSSPLGPILVSSCPGALPHLRGRGVLSDRWTQLWQQGTRGCWPSGRPARRR